MKADIRAEPPIVVAIVDDAFDVDLSLFKGMLWNNYGEVANNGLDDDQNGSVDDKHGWDASDLDENLSPPATRKNDFQHGNNIAGIIAETIRSYLGDLNDYPIKLMPVKAISDTAQHLHLKDGYLGLQYALDNNADIVNLSWSGGDLNNTAKGFLSQARQNEVLVIASVGTYPQSEPAIPASHPAVFGVAGVDKEQQLYSSNYGEEVDFTASSVIDESRPHLDGVSGATAIASAAAALMKYKNRKAKPAQIKYCLQSTSTPLDEKNPTIAGQLGSGLIEIDQAIACISKVRNIEKKGGLLTQIDHSKGSVIQRFQGDLGLARKEWQISPVGEYRGISLRPYVEGDAGESTLKVVALEESGDSDNNIIWKGLLSELPAKIDSDSSNISLELDRIASSDFMFVAGFSTRNINFSELFCSGLQEIQLQVGETFQLDDGSVGDNYATNTNCKWLLQPPPGHDIRIDFTSMNTEFDVDVLHVFRGSETTQKDLLMKISGDRVPPPIIVERFPVLLWFTSDNKNHRQGFAGRVSVVPSSTTE